MSHGFSQYFDKKEKSVDDVHESKFCWLFINCWLICGQVITPPLAALKKVTDLNGVGVGWGKLKLTLGQN